MISITAVDKITLFYKKDREGGHCRLGRLWAAWATLTHTHDVRF